MATCRAAISTLTSRWPRSVVDPKDRQRPRNFRAPSWSVCHTSCAHCCSYWHYAFYFEGLHVWAMVEECSTIICDSSGQKAFSANKDVIFHAWSHGFKSRAESCFLATSCCGPLPSRVWMTCLKWHDVWGPPSMRDRFVGNLGTCSWSAA